MSDCDDYFDWDPHENYYDPDYHSPWISDSDATNTSQGDIYGSGDNKSNEVSQNFNDENTLQQCILAGATGTREVKSLKEIIDFSTLSVEMRLLGICSALSCGWIEAAKLFIWYEGTGANFNFSFFHNKRTRPFNFERSDDFSRLSGNLVTLAVERGEGAALKLLMSMGNGAANIHNRLRGPFTSIHIAVQRQHVQCVQCLLIHGANVNSRYPMDTESCAGSTLLQRAVEKGDISLVKVLVGYGADINAIRYDGSTALNIAAARGFLDIANLLIQEGADVNLAPTSLTMTRDEIKRRKDKELQLLNSYQIEDTYLHYFRMNPECLVEACRPLLSAIQNQQEKMVCLLLENGADVNARRWDGHTALLLAVQSGCPQIVLNILKYCPKDEERNKRALYFAIQSMGTEDDVAILQKLLEYGLKLDSTDKTNPDFLRYAVRGNFMGVVRQILEFGANPNESCYEWNDFHPLHIAVIKGHKDMVKLLLKFGADPNAKDRDGNIPLLYATMLSESEIGKILLINGADALSDDLIMIFAAGNCDAKLVKILCERGCEINKRILERKVFHISQAFHEVRTGKIPSPHQRYESFLDFLPKAAGEQSTFDFERRNHFYNSYKVTPLSISARAGRLDTVRLLLEEGVDIHSEDENGITALHEAAQGGHHEIAKMLLSLDANINGESGLGTPLCLAITTQRWTVVELLLKNGAIYGKKEKPGGNLYEIVKSNAPDNIIKLIAKENFLDDHWYLADSLAYVIKQRKIELAMFLINKYQASSTCSFDKLKEIFITCTSTAIEEKLEEEANDFLDLILRLEEFKLSDSYSKLFFISADKGNLNNVTKMLNHGIYVNTAQEGVDLSQRVDLSGYDYLEGQTALHIAAAGGHVDIVKILLQYGASIKTKDEKQRSAIFYASENGHFEIVEILVKHGNQLCQETVFLKEQLDSADNKRKTPLFKASKSGHKEIVEYLLKCGSAPGVRTVHGETPLSIALRKGHLNIAEMLLQNGAAINPKDNWRLTPLLKAVKKGCYETVQFLLKHGAATEIGDDKKNKPLFLAAQKNFLKISDLLLKSGAEVNCFNWKRKTPLHIAVEKGAYEMVELLLEYGAKVNVQDSELKTPLIISVIEGRSENFQTKEVISSKSRNRVKIFKTLLMLNVDLELQDCDGKTALHHAVYGINTEMVRLLVESGAKVESKDKNGKTPLFSAVNSGYVNETPEIIETLLAAGANIDTADANGKSLIVSTLSACDRAPCLKLLLEFGATIDIQRAMKEIERISPMTRTYKNIEILMNHVIKIVAVNKHDKIGGFVKSAARYMVGMNEFRTQCISEVNQMKNEYIGETGVTFFEILIRNHGQLALLVKQEDIAQNFNTNGLEDKFPIYGSLLKTRLKIGKIRNDLIEESVKLSWYLFIHYTVLPFDVIEKVLNYLSNVDLKMLIVTCKPIRASLLGLTPSSSFEELCLFDD
ncbi:unnamed protein product [Bemisia tabaci]|uniref:F-box domain-containing protein n=1 Tax=Bemisia tabaci TaxID=7038 RepID=A0A9P0ANZ9_BEMTA|nr:unnamed protein product [Bemisia tabaci]